MSIIHSSLCYQKSSHDDDEYVSNSKMSEPIVKSMQFKIRHIIFTVFMIVLKNHFIKKLHDTLRIRIYIDNVR
jgi:hypothetical protein